MHIHEYLSKMHRRHVFLIVTYTDIISYFNVLYLNVHFQYSYL